MPNLGKEGASVKSAERPRRKDKFSLFVPMPRAIAERPPPLTAFEWAVLSAVLREAYGAWKAERSDAAFHGPGKDAVEREKERPLEYEHRKYRGMNIQAVGQEAHRLDDERRRKRGPSEPIAVRVRPTRLLASAGLKNRAEHHRRLAEALDKLTRPVGAMPPLLLRWTEMRRGLRLRVSPAWIRSGWHIVLVPLPLPVKSVQAIRLLVLLQTLDPHAADKWMRLDEVRRRLGIPGHGDRHAERGLARAVGVVNSHLASWPLARAVTSMAERYGFEIRDGGRVVFTSVDHPRVVAAERAAEAAREEKSHREMERSHEEHHRVIEEDEERERKALALARRPRLRQDIYEEPLDPFIADLAATCEPDDAEVLR